MVPASRRAALSRRVFAPWLLGFGLALAASAALAQVVEPASLRSAIEARYPGVPWVGTAELARRLQSSSGLPPRLFDARTQAEFDVSHLRGARRIDPDKPDIKALRIADKQTALVVYCSVGYRSAAVAKALQQAGYLRVQNLQGGLFQWANEGRPVYRAGRRVTRVHPYDAVWARMLRPQYRATP